MLDLVQEKLSKVLGIHLALHRVRNCDEAVEEHRFVFGHALYGADDVGQLAHAGRLDDDAVGMIGLDDLFERFAEIAHQRAADAARIHLGNLDAGLLQESAVNADFAEFVLNEHNLLALKRLLQQLFDERGLACAQKPRNNVNFGHINNFLPVL